MKKLRMLQSLASWLLTAVFVVSLGTASTTAAAPMPVLNDAALIVSAVHEYETRNWIGAAIFLNALIQRNPPEVRNNQVFANELQTALAYALNELEAYKRLSEEYARSRGTTGTGVASFSSQLSRQPPSITWPPRPSTNSLMRK